MVYEIPDCLHTIGVKELSESTASNTRRYVSQRRSDPGFSAFHGKVRGPCRRGRVSTPLWSHLLGRGRKMKWRGAIPALMGLLIIALFTANYLQNNQNFQIMDDRFARLDDRFARLDAKIDRLDEKWQIRHEKTMSIITGMQIGISAMNTNIKHLQETVSRIDRQYSELVRLIVIPRDVRGDPGSSDEEEP